MMLMVEALRPQAQRLLFLIALLGGQRLSETLLKYFYKFVESHQKFNLLWKYYNQEKYLEERSLVELHHNSGSESTLIAHGLRMQYIREHRTADVRSIASQILASSDEGRAELIQMGDAESTLVTILSAVYFTKPFKDVINTFENHCRILNDGVISRNINSGMDPLDLVKRRNEIQELVPLLNVHDGDHDWKQQAHEYAKQIIIKLACQGRLDDYSMARLLQLPQTASTGCAVLWLIFGLPRRTLHPHLDENNESFSTTYGNTMNALLTLFQDDATSTKTRVAAASTLMCVLDFEGKKVTIVNVFSKYTELLAMDSNPTLQTGLAEILVECHPTSRGLTVAAEFTTILDEFTAILEVLMGLLAFGKDCQVRVSAGRALNRLCVWKCTALKIAAIPDALDNLFNLLLSEKSLPIAPISGRLKPGCHSPSFAAGYLLGGLSSMEENRMRFGAAKSGLDGLANMLSRMEGTWRSIGEEDEREQLEKRASIAAGILGEVGLEKELRSYIGSLHGVDGGLLFLQTVEMARVLTRDMDSRVTLTVYL